MTPQLNPSILFICPEMKYRLYYTDDNGNSTYDEYIPPEIIPEYCDKVTEALQNAYIFQVEDENVLGISPGVMVKDGVLHGTITATLKRELTPNEAELLRDEVNGKVVSWSIYFENTQIETEGGNLYVRFYDSYDRVVTEIEFNNLAYVEQNRTQMEQTRFYSGTDSLSMVFYNPDSCAGGQLVFYELPLDMLQKAFAECETDDDLWTRIYERGHQYITDVNLPEFAEEARSFIEGDCDNSTYDESDLSFIRRWVQQHEQTAEAKQEM